MYNIAFLIIVSTLLLTPLISLILNIRVTFVAKAGKVNKFFWKYRISTAKVPKVLKCENKNIDVSELSYLYVYGNSMKDYDIADGQYVFVEPYKTLGAKQSIENHPVLVFEITGQKIQSKYKLRKFINYIDLQKVDWVTVYQENLSRIKISQEEFIEACRKKSQKLTNISTQYILSETLDEEKQGYAYSLHPIDTLYAKVKYACNLR